MSTQNTIVLIGSGIRKERLAGATISPGMILELQSDNTVDPHGTAAANCNGWVAIENEIFGQDLDANYVSGDMVLIEHLTPGCEFQALIDDGTAAVVVGAYLESKGDGTLRPLAASAATSQAQREGVRFQALEAVDNSGGSAPVRCRVQVV